MRLIVLAFLFLFSLGSYAEISVEFQLQDTDSDGGGDHPIFQAKNIAASAYIDLVTNEQTSYSADAAVYLPFVADGTAAYGAATYDDYNRLQGSLPSQAAGTYLRTYIRYTNTEGNSKQLWVAYWDESASEYKAYQKIIAGGIGTVTDQNYTVDILINSAAGNCFNGKADCLDGEATKTYTFFVALVEEISGLNVGDDIADSGDWAKFTVTFSGPTMGASEKPAMIGAARGDERVTLAYTTGTYIKDSDYYYRTLVVDTKGHTDADGKTYANSLGAGAIPEPDVEFYNASSSVTGTIMVKGLTNGTIYNFKMAFMDKFQFVTLFSDRAGDVIPKDIEEFLREEACYLISAGFGRSHYIIDFFKDFRDQVLLKSRLGIQFVRFYYRTAPGMALIIYKNPILRSIFRVGSYLLYFCFQYVAFLMGLAFLLLINYILFVKKVRLPQSRP